MAFYYLCDCGKKSRFERGCAPRKCGSCGRSLIGYQVFDEDEPLIEDESLQELEPEQETSNMIRYQLVPLRGGEGIRIPPQGAVIGRMSTGSYILRQDRSVSKEHIEVSYRGQIGLQITDISRFGTFLNGDRLVKNVATVAFEGDLVRLYKVEFKIARYEEEE